MRIVAIEAFAFDAGGRYETVEVGQTADVPDNVADGAVAEGRARLADPADAIPYGTRMAVRAAVGAIVPAVAAAAGPQVADLTA